MDDTSKPPDSRGMAQAPSEVNGSWLRKILDEWNDGVNELLKGFIEETWLKLFEPSLGN